MDRETYLFHQTPPELAKNLIAEVDLVRGDVVLEPFRGEGAFYNNFPEFVKKEWCEIEEGKDYKSHDHNNVDYVITNPPFRLETKSSGRENAFYNLLLYYTDKVNKGICFLGNDYCFSTLTPKRLKEINEKGFYLSKIVVCSVKKWRGRYFFIVFKKQRNDFYKYIEGNY